MLKKRMLKKRGKKAVGAGDYKTGGASDVLPLQKKRGGGGGQEKF